jgi:hypothetical protein
MQEVLEIKLWTCENVDNEGLSAHKVGDDQALGYKSCAYIDNFYMNLIHYFVIVSIHCPGYTFQKLSYL